MMNAFPFGIPAAPLVGPAEFGTDDTFGIFRCIPETVVAASLGKGFL